MHRLEGRLAARSQKLAMFRCAFYGSSVVGIVCRASSSEKEYCEEDNRQHYHDPEADHCDRVVAEADLELLQ